MKNLSWQRGPADWKSSDVPDGNFERREEMPQCPDPIDPRAIERWEGLVRVESRSTDPQSTGGLLSRLREPEG